jgi:hypothetical protein
MSPKVQRITGWVLSGLIAAVLIVASAPMKLFDIPDKEKKAEMFAQSGWTPERMFPVGVVEVLIAVLFRIPRTGFLGAILLTGYLGGATATHVRIGEPFFMPITIGVLAWVAYGLRNPVIFRLAVSAEPRG